MYDTEAKPGIYWKQGNSGVRDGFVTDFAVLRRADLYRADFSRAPNARRLR